MVTKLKLPLSKIKEFISLSSNISKSSVSTLETANYLKLEIIFGECFLVKNTIESFLEYKFSVASNIDDIEFLIHEEDFKSFCKTINSEFIYIAIFDNENETNKDIFKEIRISDSEKMKDSKKLTYNSSIIDVRKFPKTEYRVENEKKTTIGLDVINSIKIASNIVMDDSLKPMFTCVYLGDFNSETMQLEAGSTIFSSDYQCIYIKSFIQERYSFEPISILRNQFGLFSSFEKLEYIVSESHNIYFAGNNGNITFGFSKTHGTSGFGYKHFKESTKKESFISINKSDLMLFCERSKYSSGKTKIMTNSTCNISKDDIGNDICTFFYCNSEYNDEDVKECILNEKVGDFELFYLNQNHMFSIFNVVPYSEIHISNEVSWLGITSPEDEDFFMLFSKVTL